MPKSYTANKVEKLVLSIKFSTPTDPVTKMSNNVIEYYAASQSITCVAKNGEMYVPKKVPTKFYGSPKIVPWTSKQVGDAIKDFSTLNTVIYNDIKDLYVDAINEDIT